MKDTVLVTPAATFINCTMHCLACGYAGPLEIDCPCCGNAIVYTGFLSPELTLYWQAGETYDPVQRTFHLRKTWPKLLWNMARRLAGREWAFYDRVGLEEARGLGAGPDCREDE